MAENTGQGSKKVLEVINEQVKTQTAYNDILENSINTLNKVIEKNNEINKTNLGLLDISKNLVKSKFDQIKQQNQLNNLEKSLSEKSKKYAAEAFTAINKKAELEKNYYKTVKEGNQKNTEAALKAIKDNDTLIQRKTAALGIESKIYLAQLQANKVSQDSIKTLGNRLTILKGTFNSLKSGITGLAGGASKIVGAVAGGGGKDLFSTGIDLIKMIPGIGGVVGGLLGGMKGLLDFILEIEDRTVKFGRNLGYSREQSFEISNQFANIATSSGNLLITTQNLMEVQTDLSQQLGVNNILTGEMLSTQVELKKVMGLTTDEMGELAKTSIISGQNQKQIVTGVLGQVAGLKAATGISFNYKQIIGEVTKLGGALGLQFAKYPEKLTKSLLVTKSLGMDLKKVDQIAGGLLDFETAIQNQLEAQLITGKDINLSTAQQLALQGDTAGVAVELAKQMEKVGDFTKLTRIEQDAIAKAVGMERNEVADVLKNQQMLSKLSATDTKDAIVKLEALKAQGKTQEQLVALLGEGAYENLTQLSAQEKMAALIDKVKGALQDFLTKSGVVEFITGLIHKLSDPENVRGLVNMLKEGAAFIADAVQGAALGILKIADLFTEIDPALIERLEGSSAGDKIRSLGGDTSGSPKAVKDFVIQPLGEDTITMAGGTKLGRTDEMVDLLKQLLNETRQGKIISIDGAPIATAVARNAPMNYAASNLGPRPLR